MTTRVDDAASRLLDALSKVELPLATPSAAEFEATWSVICRRAGAKLMVHPCPERTPFAALAHAKPMFSLSLEGVGADGELEVLRRAASRLKVPAEGQVIPFLLIRGTEKLLCGAGVPGLLDPLLVLVGHGDGDHVPLEGVLLARDRVVAFGLDEYSDRFGAIVLDEKCAALTRLDLDGETLGFRIGEKEFQWTLEVEVVTAQKVASVELTRALGIPLRRYVKVNPTTQQLAVYSG